LERGNREMTAKEVNELSFARGVISAETETVPVPFELLDSDCQWDFFLYHLWENKSVPPDRL